MKPQHTRSTVPARYLLTLVNMMREAGIDTAALGQQLPIDLAALQADPERVVPGTTYGELYQYYTRQMQSQHFGFPDTLGENLGRYRMLFLLMINCPTLEAALARIAEFCDAFAINERMLTVHELNEQTVAIEFDIQMHKKHKNSRQGAVISANLMVAMYRITCWLTGQALPLQKVHLAAQAPARSEPYQRLFGCPVEFEAGQDALVVDRKVLTYPIVHTEQALPEIMDNWPAALFEDPAASEVDMVTRIENLIGDKLSRDIPSLDELAQRLGSPPAEIRAGLKMAGTNYKQITDTIRLQKAKKLLRETSLGLAEIAEVLGFPAASAFHRSFKRWTGETPGAYRSRTRQD